jgi:hypothetical protein
MEKYGIMGQKICHDDSLSQITVKMYVLFYTLKFTISLSRQQMLLIFLPILDYMINGLLF